MCSVISCLTVHKRYCYIEKIACNTIYKFLWYIIKIFYIASLLEQSLKSALKKHFENIIVYNSFKNIWELARISIILLSLSNLNGHWYNSRIIQSGYLSRPNWTSEKRYLAHGDLPQSISCYWWSSRSKCSRHRADKCPLSRKSSSSSSSEIWVQ